MSNFHLGTRVGITCDHMTYTLLGQLKHENHCLKQKYKQQLVPKTLKQEITSTNPLSSTITLHPVHKRGYEIEFCNFASALILYCFDS